MNICGYYPESINEGEGLRAAIFISGCRHSGTCSSTDSGPSAYAQRAGN